ncbi:hypothetical protein [Natronomonas sp.]|uniref:VNG_1110C family protein n=1 Tax=Natronomonas sp. TaxID=2184060 RepID=UPI002601CC06|nr:hypothetical protein [Natronomonas sp.]
MVDSARFRDSTEIALPADRLEGLREGLESGFSVTVAEEGDAVRIIGSPVAIKRVSTYLARHGVVFG